MSKDKQRSAEQISADIVHEVKGYFNRIKENLWVIGTPRETFEKRKTAAAYEEIAEKARVQPADVEKLVNGQFIDENKCRAICEVLIPEPDKHFRKDIVQLMGMLANAPQQHTISAPKSPASSVHMLAPEAPKVPVMKPAAKEAEKTTPKGWSPIEEVAGKYNGKLEEIKKTIVKSSSDKSYQDCFRFEGSTLYVSQRYESWLVKHNKLSPKISKEIADSIKTEKSSHIPPIIDERFLRWRSASEVTGDYEKGQYVYHQRTPTKLQKLLWGKEKNKPDKDSLFSTLVDDIKEALNCSRKEALEYAKHNLADLQHYTGDKYMVYFSPDILREALQPDVGILKRKDKSFEISESKTSLREKRAEALAKKNGQSVKKD